MPQAKVNALDQAIGSRLRARRRHLRLTQADLAKRLGVTFQQLQKYESGANRISAVSLHLAAQALETPIGFFLEGLPRRDQPESADLQRLERFVALPEAVAVASAFTSLPASKRRRLLSLMLSMAEAGPGAED
ncbi:helix-turn-helix domain-containing protein [Caulobacter sp. UNC279MFTsu5.1]|uniref:helix-turn-helix domain-containing protein n=1 Tax=Caulobacter sp. UNC279MFTsu5.1 TaxID=1502775 RepID=UPI0008E0356A|nr:helix-turn-helix transcriptional regulator [Caulobacter sp. UNC279MFTsu5.1]SFI60118.1 Helix-turn-helix domain-containing protein [Caulobacter sp. UNC279MFTsu5.1]